MRTVYSPRALGSLQLVIAVVVLHLSGYSIAVAQRYLTTFGIAAELKAGRNSKDMFAGDFDGDGYTDLGTYGSGHIYVHYQKPDSLTWQFTTTLVRKDITKATAASCNRDRMTDIVFITDNPPAIHSLLGKRQRRFTLGAKKSLPQPVDKFAVSDLNSDGISDLLFYGKKTLGVSVWLGKNGGSFKYSTTLFPEESYNEFQTSDLNGDGLIDILASRWISNQVVVYFAFGILKFSEPSEITLSSEPTMITAAFLDSDGNQDIVVVSENDQTCQTFLGDGLGGFYPLQSFSLGGSPVALRISDVNGDARDDVGILLRNSDCLTLALNNGSGVLEEQVKFSAGRTPVAFTPFQHLHTNRFNAAVLDSERGRVRIFYSTGIQGSVAKQHMYGTGVNPSGILSFDLNHDGWNDIVVANAGSETISLFMNRRDGTFGGQISFTVSISPEQLQLLASTESTATFLASSGDFRTIAIIEVNTKNYSHTSYNLPIQGKTEVLYARKNSTTNYLNLIVLEHDEEDGYPSLINYNQISQIRFVERNIDLDGDLPIVTAALCDYNRDGHNDLIYLTYDSKLRKEEVSVAFGIDENQFQSSQHVVAYDVEDYAPAQIWCSDLNGDRFLDLVVNLKEPKNLVSIVIGHDDSTFALPDFRLQHPISISTKDALQVFDMNSDGVLDIVVENSLKKSIEIYYGKGDGTFYWGSHLASTEGVGGFILSDINNDTSPELIVTDDALGVLRIISLGE